MSAVDIFRKRAELGEKAFLALARQAFGVPQQELPFCSEVACVTYPAGSNSPAQHYAS